MQFDKTPVAEAIESTVAPVRAKVTPVALVKFKPKAKVTTAVEMTPAQYAIFETGEALGYATVENDLAWAEALRACKVHADRIILRHGFVSAVVAAGRKTKEQAERRFTYMASLHSPQTSRKKSGGKRPNRARTTSPRRLLKSSRGRLPTSRRRKRNSPGTTTCATCSGSSR